jgi:hypothetical protein
MQKQSFGPQTLANLGPAAAQLEQLAQSLGRELDDVQFAVANDPTLGAAVYNILVVRIRGAESEALLRGYATFSQQSEAGSTLEDRTLAGRELVHLKAPQNPVGGVWMYAKGDTLYGVQTNDEATATKVLNVLP